MENLTSIAREITSQASYKHPKHPKHPKHDINVKEQIRNNPNSNNIFDKNEDLVKHLKSMRELIELEYKQKRRFRAIATYGVFVLVTFSIVGISWLIFYLVRYKNYTPPPSVIIGIAVSSIANIIGLAMIVFKYLYSSTKETTDYLNKINHH